MKKLTHLTIDEVVVEDNGTLTLKCHDYADKTERYAVTNIPSGMQTRFRVGNTHIAEEVTTRGIMWSVTE